MTNPTPPVVPPPPPPPPPQPTQAPSEAQPPAEQPTTPQPGTDAAQMAEEDEEEAREELAQTKPADAPLTVHPASDAKTQQPAEAADDDAPDLPLVPAIESIPQTVRIVMLAGGIPEAIFAKDLKIPFEEREDLIRKVAKALTGMDIPVGDDQLTNVAANCTTVKDVIEFFELSHPDHPSK